MEKGPSDHSYIIALGDYWQYNFNEKNLKKKGPSGRTDIYIAVRDHGAG